MLGRTCWAVALVLGGLAAPAYGQTKLEWKFKEGDKFYIENATKLKQTITVMGREMKQDTDNTTVTRFEVKKRTSDQIVLEEKIVAVKVKNTGGFGGEAEKMAEQMKGATFTITLSPDGKLIKQEGYDDLIKRLTKNNQQAEKMIRLMLPAETFTKAVQEAFGFLPSKPVQKGDSWKNSTTLPMGPLGEFKVNNTYTFQGKTEGGDKIALAATMTYSAPKGDGGGLPFKISKADFKSDSFKGTIVFDPDRGRLVRSEMTGAIKGTMTIEAGGNQVEMTLEQNHNITSRLLDKAPSDD
jgi:hypothetical protein